MLAVPYITSFCTHTDDQPYERKNGLLSQWRGYARGGYAIVFDTKKLCAMYQTDAQNYYYSAPCHISDVVYQGDEEFFNEEFGESIGKIIEAFRKLRATGEIQAGEIFGDIVSIFTRLKHTGFFEEREVRAVAFPVTNEIEEGYRSVNPDYVSPDLALKPIHIREDGVPYIETLNHSDGTRLPIKRIIIGPQEEQNRAKAVIDHLVANSGIEVHCSDTPLSW